MPVHENHDKGRHALLIYRDGETFECGTDPAPWGTKFIARILCDGSVCAEAWAVAEVAKQEEPFVYINTTGDKLDFRSGRTTRKRIDSLFAFLRSGTNPEIEAEVDAFISGFTNRLVRRLFG